MTPEGWKRRKLFEIVAHLSRGKAPTYVKDPHGVFAVNQKCIRHGRVSVEHVRPHNASHEITPEAFLRDGDVCINSTGNGTIGRVGLWRDPQVYAYFADTHVTIARPIRNLVVPKFLCETLLSADLQRRMETECFTGSTSQVELSRTALAGLDLLLPPLPEQRKIATILSSVDEVIEKTEAVIEQLGVVKQAMMQELLTRGLSGRDTRFKQTEIGEIPDSWEVRKVREISHVVRGSTPRPARDPRFFNGDHTPWITVGELSKDGAPFLDSTTTFLTEAGTERSRLLNAGTVVLSNSGFGLGVPKVLRISGCANDGIAAFLDLDVRMSPLFLYYWLASKTDELRTKVARGVEQPNLNTTLIGELVLPVPPREEQIRIADALGSLDDRLASERWYAKELARTKTALTSVLLAGEVRVTLDECAA